MPNFHNAAGDDVPIFRMVQLNDLHLRSLPRLDGDDLDAQDHYNSLVKSAALMRDILDERHGPRPDLIVAAGDIADEPEDACHHLAAEYLGRFVQAGIPVLPIPGNHEFNLQAKPDTTGPYLRFFGGDLIDYAFYFRGVLFVMIFNGWSDPPPDEAMNRRADWLERTFKQFPDTPKIICAHIPFEPMRDPEVLKASFGFSSWMDLDDQRRVQSILARSEESIIAVLHGHLHLTSVTRTGGLHAICPSGTLSWPAHYACYEFYSDHVRIRMRHTDWELNQASFPGSPLGNGVHDRHQRDFTDSRHATMRDYIMGNPDEWDVTLPLTGARHITPEPSVVARKANGWPAPNTRSVRLASGTGTMDAVRVTNFGTQPRVALAPLTPESGGPFYVVSEDGREIYLNALYEKTWTADELAGGVPALVPAGGAVTLCLTRQQPAADTATVSTAQLRAREYQLALQRP